MKIHDEETSDLRRLFPWSETECHRSQSLQGTFQQRKKSLTCRIVWMDWRFMSNISPNISPNMSPNLSSVFFSTYKHLLFWFTMQHLLTQRNNQRISQHIEMTIFWFYRWPSYSEKKESPLDFPAMLHTAGCDRKLDTERIYHLHHQVWMSCALCQ